MTTSNNSELSPDAQQVRFPLRQFLLLCLPVAVAIIATAFAISGMRFQAQLDNIVAAERTHLYQLGGYVAADVSTSLIHIRALSQETVVGNALDTAMPRSLQDLQSVFMTMARRNPSYLEISWIDETGAERVRVERRGDSVHAVAAPDLVNISNRYYFNAARQLLSGEVYISHLDLSVENDGTETSVKPMLRVATPVQDTRGRERGILVININMKHMIAALRNAGEASPDTDYALVNKDGDWLTVQEQTDHVIFQLDTRGQVTREHPAAWERVSTSRAGVAELDDGFWIWQRLTPEDIIRRVVLAESGSGTELPVINQSDFSLVLVAHMPARTVAGFRDESRATTIPFAILLLVAFAWGLVLLLRGQQTERRAALSVAYAMTRANHMERLKELEARFHLVVEASGVGMVVVDEDGDILMNNSAAEAMLGYPEDGLLGLSVDKLLPPVQRSQHARMRAGYLQHPEARKMGAGRKLEALTADGRKIPVEVGLNPYLDHGKQVVLASIIDLSK